MIYIFWKWRCQRFPSALCNSFSCCLVCDLPRSFREASENFPVSQCQIRSRCWRAVGQEKKLVGLVAMVCLVDIHSGNPATCTPLPLPPSSLWWWWPFPTLARTRKGRGESGPFYLQPHFSFPLFYNFFCIQLRYVNRNREVNHNYEK